MTAASAATIEHAIGTEGLLVLHMRDGSIRLHGVDGDTASVIDRDGTDLAEAFTIERGEGSLELRAGQGFQLSIGRKRHQAPDLEVRVPRHANVVVQAASADFTADDLGGDQRYQTVSGDISLTRARGSVEIDSTSGDVKLSAAGELRLAARTVSGDLDARAGRLTELSVATTSGDVSVAGELAPDIGHTIETVSGDVLLAIAGGVRVEVTTVAGDVRSDVPHSSEGGRGHRVLVVGDGRATLAARSMSGDIRIVAARPFETGPLPPEPPAAPAPPAPPAAPAPVPPIAAAGPSDAAIGAAYEEARLGILRSVERGEIDVAEAGRRLEALDAADVPEVESHD